MVLLGAGASFGAGLTKTPPMMANFMREMQAVAPEACDSLLSLCERLGLPRKSLLDGETDLEALYVTLEAVSTGLWYINLADYRQAVGEDFHFTTPADWLRDLMVQVLEPPSLEAIRSPCPLHGRLFESLEQGDSVISFNYDLIADSSLAQSGQWFELAGYGFLDSALLREKHFEDSDVERPCAVSLLKPHGSLNWRLEPAIYLARGDDVTHSKLGPVPVRQELLGTQGKKGTERLEITPLSSLPGKAGSYSVGSTVAWAKYYRKLLRDNPGNSEMILDRGISKASGAPLIVPPGYYKFRAEQLPSALVDVWSAVWRALRGADRLVCVGYSFPATDAEFLALFRIALAARQDGTAIEIVNPDTAIIERVKRLAPTAQVWHAADTLEEYCEDLV